MRISLLPNVGSGSQVPSLAKEGWLRHQKDAAKPPSPAQTGWLVPKKLFWSLNEPPRPRLSLEREFFLMARPPLLCQGGEFAPPKRSARLNAYISQGVSQWLIISQSCKTHGGL